MVRVIMITEIAMTKQKRTPSLTVLLFILLAFFTLFFLDAFLPILPILQRHLPPIKVTIPQMRRPTISSGPSIPSKMRVAPQTPRVKRMVRTPVRVKKILTQ